MWLTITRGEGRGHTVEIADRPLSIGRDPDCDIVVPDARVSRRHAEARPVEGGGAEIADLGSSNGTFVDGQRVTEPVQITAGQSVQVGDTILRADPMRPGEDRTVVGGPAVAPPPPPPPPGGAPDAPPSGQRRPTTEVLNLRRSVRRNTIIGVSALAAVVVAGGIIAALLLTGGDDDGERSISEIVDDTRDSTVEVLAAIDGDIQGGGTGWVWDAGEGLIVTNAHVVNGGTEFQVALEEDEDPRSAEIVAVAPCEDLAVLRTEETDGLRTLPLGDQGSLDLGDTIVALGYPGSASREGNLTATSGVVSVARTRFDLEAVDVPQYPNVIQTDTAINPGNSGGPLIDTAARLVGVNSAGITLLGGRDIQGQGYAIGVDRVKEIVPTLVEGKSIGWTGMGFVFPGPGDESALESIGLPAVDGILVPFAVEDTPAARAGFGDQPVLVVGVNGEDVQGSLPSYCSAAGDTEAGRQITFTVVQPGATGTQDVRVSVAGEE